MTFEALRWHPFPVTTASHVALKRIRRLLGVTQRALGRKLGVTVRTVTRWELGQSAMPLEALRGALGLLRASDPTAADRIALEVGIPSALAQEGARRAAVEHAVYVVADALDVSPRKARRVLALFLTHLTAAGLDAVDAHARIAARIAEDELEKAAPPAGKNG